MNGLGSDEFDIIGCLSFDSDNGSTSSFLNQDGIYTEHYNGQRTIHRLKTNEVFSPTITFIKKDYSDFDAGANRRILSWLTATDKPGWIEFYKDDSNVMEYRIFGGVESLELYKLGNSRVVGYVVTFTSTHPYAWSRKFTYPEVYNTIEELNNNDETNDYLAVSGTSTFTLTCDTDEYNKLVYPQVTINFSNQNVYIPINTDPMKDNYVMIPNAIYSYNGGYYVNLPSEGKKVQLESNNPITSNMDHVVIDSGNYILNGYYYFTQEGVIAQKVSSQDSQGKTQYAWKIITEVGAAVKIENTTTETSTIVAGGILDETIILDGTNKVISSYTTVNGALVQNTKIIGDHFSWEWLALKYGDNNITITGNCEVKIEWLEPRKVGDL